MTARCPTPRKHRYRTELDAKIALASTHSAGTRQRHQHAKREETRVYRCACGGWHLTSKGRR